MISTLLETAPEELPDTPCLSEVNEAWRTQCHKCFGPFKLRIGDYGVCYNYETWFESGRADGEHIFAPVRRWIWNLNILMVISSYPNLSWWSRKTWIDHEVLEHQRGTITFWNYAITGESVCSPALDVPLPTIVASYLRYTGNPALWSLQTMISSKPLTKVLPNLGYSYTGGTIFRGRFWGGYT